MKRFCYLLAIIMPFIPLRGRTAETASGRIYCYSLRFQRGIDPNGNYYLDLTSVKGTANGELALDFLNSGYTHSTYLSLIDELLGDTLSGAMAVYVPDGGDANGNGFPDFFEVSQGVPNLTSSGGFNLPVYGNGLVTATWNRSAGSKDGTCVLRMKLMPSQPVAFSLAFELLEYTGPVHYAGGATNVSGSLHLVQTGNPTSWMEGLIQLVKVSTNRFNKLTLQASTWTNEAQQPLSFTNAQVLRDTRWPTNYYGTVEFDDDGDPSTYYPYAFWMLSIDDTNDANHNGIPDFSDDPSATPLPRQPQLSLAQSLTNLVLTLRGDVGHVHEIQMVSDLSSNNWQTAVSVLLTNDPQEVSLALPDGPQTFWRVRAR